MSSINVSDMDHYKREHECNEHWELRRKFLLAFCDKYPLDKLISLSIVFTNIEFLGCTYPAEIMESIAELSKDVVKDYREKEKTMLQTSFINASDTADSKTKEHSEQETCTNQHNKEERFCNTVEHSCTVECSCNCDQSLLASYKVETNSEELNSVVNMAPNKQNKEDDISFEYINEAQTMVAQVASACNISLDWKHEVVNNTSLCTVFFNKYKLITATGPDPKTATKEAAVVALKEIQKIYCTDNDSKNLTPTFTENLSEIKDTINNSNVTERDNIGKRMMKLMGWSGGGLGKSSQGITEPISIQQQITKKGLGFIKGKNKKKACKKKFTEISQNFIKSSTLLEDVTGTFIEVETLQPSRRQLGPTGEQRKRLQTKAQRKKMARARNKAARECAQAAKTPTLAASNAEGAPLHSETGDTLKSGQEDPPTEGSPPKQLSEAYDFKLAVVPTSAASHVEGAPLHSETRETLKSGQDEANPQATAYDFKLAIAPTPEMSHVEGAPLRSETGETLKRGQQDPPSEEPASKKLKNANGRRLRKKRRTWTSANEFKLAVVPGRYPDERLNNQQIKLVLDALDAAILDVADGSHVPCFRNYWRKKGTLIFQCISPADKEWLFRNAPTWVPWEGAKLLVLYQSELERMESVTIVARGARRPDVILKLLSIQNKTLRAQNWKVTGAWQERAKYTVKTSVSVLVAGPDIEALRALNFRPFCGAERAEIAYNGTVAGGEKESGQEMSSADEEDGFE